MKLKVSRAEFLNGLDRVIGAVAQRGAAYPLLTHVLLDVFLTHMELAATDTMVYARTTFPVVAEMGGRVAVPAERLRGAVDRSGEEISITLKDGLILSLTGDDRLFDLPCLDAADYPAPFDLAYAPPFGLDHGILPSIVNGLKHAVSGNQIKSHLCGIRMEFKDKTVTACATDGHRLSLAARDFHSAWDLTFSFTVPSRACTILAGIDSCIEVSYPEIGSMVQFESAKSDLGVRLLEGDFPNYRAVIPKDLDKGVTVNTAALIDALESCGVVAEDAKNKSVQITTTAGKLCLTTLGLNGTAMVTLPYLGDDMEPLRMNSKYFLQAAKSLGGEELFIKFKDARSPILLIPVDHGQWSERLEVIMPMRG